METPEKYECFDSLLKLSDDIKPAMAEFMSASPTLPITINTSIGVSIDIRKVGEYVPNWHFKKAEANTATCSTCPYWEKDGDKYPDRGLCKKNSSHTRSVTANNWCGEHPNFSGWKQKTCNTCDGTGVIEDSLTNEFGHEYPVYRDCPNCDGKKHWANGTCGLCGYWADTSLLLGCRKYPTLRIAPAKACPDFVER